jgi:hypothetical protein
MTKHADEEHAVPHREASSPVICLLQAAGIIGRLDSTMRRTGGGFYAASRGLAKQVTRICSTASSWTRVAVGYA